MSESLAVLGVESAVLAFALVGLVRQLALRHGVLDHPTDRSSHVTATPRGGGVGLVLAVLTISAWRATRPFDVAVALLLLGTALIAAVGWIDDRRGLGVRTRLSVHVAMAMVVGGVAASRATPSVGAILVFGWWTFWTVSSVNLVNFMDGINGLVASQIAIFAFSLALFPASSTPVPLLAIVLGAACVGFLPWNFPRARIFLGDAGSGGLGYLVPCLALLAARGDVDFVRAHLPLVPLFGDATWTILRRWRNGERLTEAHRSHLYQRLANGGMGHTAVTLLYAAAALAGALAAHAAGPWGASPWTVAYAMSTILVGYWLHRRASRPTSAVS
jgi:UDP-N-acetylmuramyl pentapeptide phosphotransferase/UDP-N-acetylglucosamine-1-phosphate transferase